MYNRIKAVFEVYCSLKLKAGISRMKKFETENEESFQSKLKRITFNFFPAYRRTGGRICFISENWQEVHIKLGLKWSTKNYVGSVFGGSIYAAVDPIYMVQLIQILGDNYIVWDKSAKINFRRPIKKTVFAQFLLTDELIQSVKDEVAEKQHMLLDLKVKFVDEQGLLYADISKTLYIADKKYYKEKNKGRKDT